VITEARGARLGAVGWRSDRTTAIGQPFESIDELSKPRRRNDGLDLGAVIHGQRVAPTRGWGVVGTGAALSVPLQSSRGSVRASNDVPSMDIRRQVGA
jgi:hypothetical protein